ncbi:Acyl-coenzyme A oxidase (Acyl-CoA oxidase) [Halocaridina rubra]|uniref:Acyl-coenzyme A oxidase (Acyl-CoA oxidase) n=1 Tax=Halocaridina rubra TaxID=373956 RepID=A0AAN8X392_HALRR
MSDRGCVSDLAKERANCSFSKEELTNLIDGSAERTEFRRQVENVLLKDPVLTDKISTDYMSHEERYTNAVRKTCHMMNKFRDDEELKELAAGEDGLR